MLHDRPQETWLLQSIKGPFSENHSKVNVLTSPKKLEICKKAVSPKFFYHSETNWFRKIYFFTRSKILGLLVNKLTADYWYYRSNRVNLSLPTQLQLSKKAKTICRNFIAFLECKLDFDYFPKKKMSHIA